jgi:hypothetical protein
MENSEPVIIPVAGFADIEGQVPVRNEHRNQELWLRELKSVYPEAVAMLEASGWPLRDREIASPAALFTRRDESGGGTAG